MVRGILMGHVIEAVSKEVFTGIRGGVLAEQSMRQLDSSDMPAPQKRRLRDVLTATRNLAQANAQTGTSVSAPGMTTPYTVKAVAETANENVAYNGSAHSFAGMGIQFLLFAAIDLGIGILLERQRGLWKRLRSAPLSRGMLLGGAWVPSFVFPQWLQQATVVIPTKWAVDGLDAMTWRGIGLSGALLPTVVSLGFAALFCGVAVWRFRWEES